MGLWFKDQTFSLRKLDKAEDAVYETFLHVHKEKRKLQKDAYKKKQEEARKLADDARKRALDTIDLLVPSDAETLDTADRTTVEVKLPILTAKTKVSKVIEVVKVESSQSEEEHKHSEDAKTGVIYTAENSEKTNSGLVGECTNLPIPPIEEFSVDVNDEDKTTEVIEESSPTQGESNSKTSKTKKVHKKFSKSLSKGDIISNTGDDKSKPIMKRRSGLSNFLITPQNVSNEEEAFTKPLATKTTYRKSFTNIMPVINEDEHGGVEVSMPVTTQSQPLTLSYESVFSVPLVSESDLSSSSEQPQSASSPSSEPGVDKNGVYASESLVKINKRKKRNMERRRKMVLDMEPFQTYTRDSNGEVLPAVNPFKKKTFLPPSNKEKYFQKKMLAAQKDARASQDQKIEDFYRKLDTDKGKPSEDIFCIDQ